MGVRPEIERRLRAGERQVDVRRALGVSMQYVCQVAASIGIGTRADRNRRAAARRMAPVSAPQIVQMLDALPDDTLAWLIAETPAGATLADTLRAVIADAHFDAVGA